MDDNDTHINAHDALQIVTTLDKQGLVAILVYLYAKHEGKLCPFKCATVLPP